MSESSSSQNAIKNPPSLPPLDEDRAPPTTLGDYTLVREIGRGGMGTVYEAIHSRLDKRVALKVLPSGKLQSADAVARFEREMKAVGKLSHPHIVQAHDARELDGYYFLVLEFVNGADLDVVVTRNGPLKTADACEIIRQAALGLQHAHEHSLVHRDIKPSNLLLSFPSDDKVTTGHHSASTVKILDLGLALLDSNETQGEELTSTGQIMGTLDYIAPEQISDTHGVDIRADLYALGCTLYKLLTGDAPFAHVKGALKKMKAHGDLASPSVRDHRSDVPDGLVAIIDRLLAKEPDDRFASPIDVASALQPFCDGSDLSALAVALPESSSASLNQAVVKTSSRVSQTGHTETVISDGAVAATSEAHASNQPQLSPAPQSTRSNRKTLIAIGLMVLAALAMMFGGQIFRVATGKGLLIIEADDPSIEVTITLGDDKSPVTIHDRQTERQYTLDIADDYRVVVTEPSTGASFQSDRFTITRGGKQVLDVRGELAKPAMATGDPGSKSSDPQFKTLEPPPLDEWLKDREILTVAKDGSGMFDSIQAALDALKPGQVVEVLDEGPYHERLEFTPSEDVGLVTRKATRLVVPQPRTLTGKALGQLIGHNAKFANGLRLSGFVFGGESGPEFKTLLVRVGKSLTIEDCMFLPSGNQTSSTVEPLSLQVYCAADRHDLRVPIHVRNCVFDSTCRFGAESGSPTFHISHNFFASSKELPHCYVFHHPPVGGTATRHTHFIRNVFGPSAKIGLNLDIADAQSDVVVVRENTFLSWQNGIYQTGELTPGVTVQGNIFAPTAERGALPLAASTQLGLEKIRETWQISGNAYSDKVLPVRRWDSTPDSASVVVTEKALDSVTNEFGRFVSPQHREDGAGALSFGPAPTDGDWFTRLLDRRRDAQRIHHLAVSDNSNSKAEIDEPPPLEEWLKGREILTVAQDGTGQFDTIQAALDALKPGQVAEILDKGPYIEIIKLDRPSGDTGLFSRCRTVIQPSKHENVGALHSCHVVSHAVGFRLDGLRFESIDVRDCELLRVNYPKSVAINNCDFVQMSPIVSPKLVGLAVLVNPPDVSKYRASKSSCTFVGCQFRQCAVRVFQKVGCGTLHVDASHNYFLNDHWQAAQFEVNAGSIGIRKNIFACSSTSHKNFSMSFNSPKARLAVDNNTIVSGSIFLVESHQYVSLQGNIFSGIRFHDQIARSSRSVKHWQIGHNCYLNPNPEFDSFQETDIAEKQPFQSEEVSHNDYLTLRTNSGLAMAGAGKKLPNYVGALPPRSAAGELNWFSRIRSVRQAAGLDQRVEIPNLAFEIPEPPPLEEWLQGREILTVAKDGSGQFDTIQAALDALKPGQCVEVLDKGPYVESLKLVKKSNVGIVSRSGATIQVEEWVDTQDASNGRLGFDFGGCDDLRLSGLSFEAGVPQDKKFRMFQLFGVPGACVENCRFVSASTKFDQHAVLHMFPATSKESPSTTIRRCVFDEVIVSFPAPKYPSDIQISHCLFRHTSGSHPVSIHTSDDPTAATAARVHNNVIISNTSPLTLRRRPAGGNEANEIIVDHNTIVSNVNGSGFNRSLLVLYGLPANNLHWTNNLLLGDPRLGLNKDNLPESDQERAVRHWQIVGNAFSEEHRSSAPFLRNPGNHPLDVSTVKQNLSDPACFRIPTSGTLATGGNDKAASYIGALPPGPAPPEGDWFTQLLDLWHSEVDAVE